MRSYPVCELSVQWPEWPVTRSDWNARHGPVYMSALHGNSSRPLQHNHFIACELANGFFFFLISRLLMLSPFVICGTPTDLNRILAFGQIYWKQETQNRSPRISWGLVMEHSGSCGCPDGINMLINTWSVRATFYSCFNRALQILPHLTVHSLYFPKLYFFILNLLRYLYFWFKNRKTWSSLMRAVRGMGTTYFHILFACM